GQALDQRHARGGELLEVEAEVDQVLARDLAGAEEALHVARRAAADEVELHALQALLEVEQVDRLQPADHALARGVDGLVAEERHAATPCGPSGRRLASLRPATWRRRAPGARRRR